ncbi:hypothetical protein SCUP515_08279 [Seiridium cupressi]
MDATVFLDEGDGNAGPFLGFPERPRSVQDDAPIAARLERDESRGRKKTHQRSVTAVRVSDVIHPEETRRDSTGPNGVVTDHASESPPDEAIGKGQLVTETYLEPDVELPHRSVSPATVPDATSVVNETNESESESGSSSTVTESSYERRGSRVKRDRKSKGSPSTRLDAFKYLDPDSPTISQEAIRASFDDASAYRSSMSPMSTSPSSRSTASSSRSIPYSDGLSEAADHDTDRSTSPEQSPANRGLPLRSAFSSNRRHRSYGTPEMPRGKADLPHISPKVLSSRISGQAPAQPHIKHLPRAEKLPLTGYEQLATQLAGQDSDRSGPRLRPMYRRFEILNHRLLLHLQDELCELEEQLHRLDTTDTQTRRVQNRILPASRRAEALSGGELQWHRTDVLGKIGFKLEQYNRILSSFKSTECLESPTMADVHEYRGYLATHALIAETETHFLDQSEDLVCLDETSESSDNDEDMAATPMPRQEPILASPGSRASSFQHNSLNQNEKDNVADRALDPINFAMVTAVVIPTLSFSLIPGYLSRMVVVILVGLGVVGALLQTQEVGTYATKHVYICAGAYGAVMAVIAGVCR